MREKIKNRETLLVNSLKKGDIGSFDKLFAEYSEKLFLFAIGYLKKQEDAEGLVQEVFIKVWEKRHQLRLDLSFKSFLFTIAYNAIVDHFRKWSKEEQCLEYFRKTPDLYYNDPEKEMVYSDLEELALKTIERLSPKRKLIYRLSRQEKLTNKEIAERLKISIKTVEYNISQALKFLKEHLGKELLSSLLFFPLFI
jgi:RNA polymerase sigma-70 factor (ECF subfamily)